MFINNFSVYLNETKHHKFKEAIMHATEFDIEPCNYEIIIYSGSWLFSTFAQCFCAQTALDAAEEDLQAHARQHKLQSLEGQATSAYVINGGESNFFRRRDGEWHRAQYPAVPGSLAKRGSPLSNGKAQRRAAA